MMVRFIFTIKHCVVQLVGEDYFYKSDNEWKNNEMNLIKNLEMIEGVSW